MGGRWALFFDHAAVRKWKMLNIITYFWRDDAWPEENSYTVEDVRFLQRSVAKNMTQPHRFACITDRPELFDDEPDIWAIPLDMATYVPGRCYVRLMTFSPKMAEIFDGGRVLQVDLDGLIVGDMDELVLPDYDLIMLRNSMRVPWENPVKPGRPYYNTSMLLHRTGTLIREVWESFDINTTPNRFKDDQWYLSALLGPDAPYWDETDGVYRLARKDTPGPGVWGELPDNAKIVFGTGSEGKLWQPHNRIANPWVERFVEGSPRFQEVSREKYMG